MSIGYNEIAVGDGVDQVGLALFYRGAAAVDALAAVATRRCRRWDRFFRLMIWSTYCCSALMESR